MPRLLSILCLLVTLCARGATNYVSQTGGGSTNSLGWLNNTYNPASNDLVMLEGTLTTNIAFKNGPLVGVTIRFDTNACIVMTTSAITNEIINLSGAQNCVIDGGYNGYIAITDNGTTAANGGTNDFAYSLCGIYAESINNVTVQNLSIRNLYNRTTNIDSYTPSGAYGNGMGVAFTGNGLTLSNVFFTGMATPLSLQYGTGIGSNLTVSACTLSNYNHALELNSISTGAYFYNVMPISNKFMLGDMFETGPGGQGGGFHRDGIFFNLGTLDGTGYMSNVVIANNYFQAGVKPLSSAAGTGTIYCGNTSATLLRHVRCYNNISTAVYPLTFSGGNGLLGIIGEDVVMANNTCVGWQTNGVYGEADQISIGGATNWLYNNVCCSAFSINITAFSTTSNNLSGTSNDIPITFSAIYSDYNIFNGPMTNVAGFCADIALNSLNNGPFRSWGNYNQSNFTSWRAVYPSHLDLDSLTNNLVFGSGFIPATNSVAISNGLNLTAFALSNDCAGVLTDYAGNARPSTGAWTIGAYQVGTNAPIANPYGLTIHGM